MLQRARSVAVAVNNACHRLLHTSACANVFLRRRQEINRFNFEKDLGQRKRRLVMGRVIPPPRDLNILLRNPPIEYRGYGVVRKLEFPEERIARHFIDQEPYRTLYADLPYPAKQSLAFPFAAKVRHLCNQHRLDLHEAWHLVNKEYHTYRDALQLNRSYTINKMVERGVPRTRAMARMNYEQVMTSMLRFRHFDVTPFNSETHTPRPSDLYGYGSPLDNKDDVATRHEVHDMTRDAFLIKKGLKRNVPPDEFEYDYNEDDERLKFSDPLDDISDVDDDFYARKRQKFMTTPAKLREKQAARKASKTKRSSSSSSSSATPTGSGGLSTSRPSLRGFSLFSTRPFSSSSKPGGGVYDDDDDDDDDNSSSNLAPPSSSPRTGAASVPRRVVHGVDSESELEYSESEEEPEPTDHSVQLEQAAAELGEPAPDNADAADGVDLQNIVENMVNPADGTLRVRPNPKDRIQRIKDLTLLKEAEYARLRDYGNVQVANVPVPRHYIPKRVSEWTDLANMPRNPDWSDSDWEEHEVELGYRAFPESRPTWRDGVDPTAGDKPVHIADAIDKQNEKYRAESGRPNALDDPLDFAKLEKTVATGSRRLDYKGDMTYTPIGFSDDEGAQQNRAAKDDDDNNNDDEQDGGAGDDDDNDADDLKKDMESMTTDELRTLVSVTSHGKKVNRPQNNEQYNEMYRAWHALPLETRLRLEEERQRRREMRGDKAHHEYLEEIRNGMNYEQLAKLGLDDDKHVVRKGKQFPETDTAQHPNDDFHYGYGFNNPHRVYNEDRWRAEALSILSEPLVTYDQINDEEETLVARSKFRELKAAAEKDPSGGAARALADYMSNREQRRRPLPTELDPRGALQAADERVKAGHVESVFEKRVRARNERKVAQLELLSGDPARVQEVLTRLRDIDAEPSDEESEDEDEGTSTANRKYPQWRATALEDEPKSANYPRKGKPVNELAVEDLPLLDMYLGIRRRDSKPVNDTSDSTPVYHGPESKMLDYSVFKQFMMEIQKKAEETDTISLLNARDFQLDPFPDDAAEDLPEPPDRLGPVNRDDEEFMEALQDAKRVTPEEKANEAVNDEDIHPGIGSFNTKAKERGFYDVIQQIADKSWKEHSDRAASTGPRNPVPWAKDYLTKLQVARELPRLSRPKFSSD